MKSPYSQDRARARSGGLEIAVDHALGPLFDRGAEWDQLLAMSPANTIFLTSGWLRAWAETYGQGAQLLVPQVRQNGKLVGAAAFRQHNGVITFAGAGPSDYMDLVLDSSLDQGTTSTVIDALLLAAQAAASRFRFFWLERVPLENGTLAGLTAGGSRYYATPLGHVLAPSMDMSAAPERLRKKSLRRHERALEREGAVQTETFTQAHDIFPRLDEFFDQHLRRWQDTPDPSLFTDDNARVFYRMVTRNLDRTGWLRFTDVRLNGRLVAAHFGFLHAGRFVWYKPTYEPALAKYSPGEVLLKRLIERAQAEGASELDFTIGEEAFKYRFATKTREVATLHITDSLLRAWMRRAKRGLGRIFRRVFQARRESLLANFAFLAWMSS